MNNYADEIKRLVPMREAAEFYGYTPNAAGYINCPFHGEKTPSCKIYDGDRGWHCFGCGKGGSVIDFVEYLFGLQFIDAVCKINEDFCLDLPIGKQLSEAERIEAGRKQFQLRKAKRERIRLLQQLDEEYWKAFEKWQRYDTWKRELAPQTPDEPINPLYAEACRNIDKAADDLDAALRRRDLEYGKNNGNGAILHSGGIPRD